MMGPCIKAQFVVESLFSVRIAGQTFRRNDEMRNVANHAGRRRKRVRLARTLSAIVRSARFVTVKKNVVAERNTGRRSIGRLVNAMQMTPNLGLIDKPMIGRILTSTRRESNDNSTLQSTTRSTRARSMDATWSASGAGKGSAWLANDAASMIPESCACITKFQSPRAA